VGTGDPMGDPYPRGYRYGVNSYPPVYMGDPVGLFFCRGYGYEVVIPGGYLPIAISNLLQTQVWPAYELKRPEVRRGRTYMLLAALTETSSGMTSS
jgi:hypothetical protein